MTGSDTLNLAAADGLALHVLCWRPNETPKAVVQIAHGMGEHAGRYQWLAERLNSAGFAVYAQDHRGHGVTTPPDSHGDMGEDGWNRAVEDLETVRRRIVSDVPDVPIVLLGHSMGAMLAQQYACLYGESLDALVLSGSPGLRSAVTLTVGYLLARIDRWRLGPDAVRELTGYNDPWAGSNATGFEWLSRDAQQVGAYVDDPFCGFMLRTGSMCDLLGAAHRFRRKSRTNRVPTALPIFVFSGGDDPVHDECKGINRLVARYRAGGRNVDVRFYPGGRHEMFNETNREEVVDDLLDWLAKHIA